MVADSQPTGRGGSRAFGPGSSRRALGLVAAALAVALALTAAVVLTRPGGPVAGAAPATGSTAKYGQIPAWLPKAAVPVGRTVEASAGHPWLAIEGDSVSVRLARGRVTATTVGPAVPREGAFPVPATSPCAFTVTLTAASGAVPVTARAFTILDEFGHLHHPRVIAAGGGSPPARVARGRTVTLTVTTVLPTGNGQLRWAPAGARPVVSWDFDVEID
jgi:hypothetical protein